MMTHIHIRPTRSGDWAQLEGLVAGICQHHGDTHKLTRAQFDALATKPNAPMIVLVAETLEGVLAGYVAGFAIFSFQEGAVKFEVQNLFVREEFRGHKIGELLMTHIMQMARDKHKATLFRLSAHTTNDNAINFYRHIGFIENETFNKITFFYKETGT